MAKRDDRFIRTYEQSSFGSSVEIWVDRETGVNYLYHNSGYGYGGSTKRNSKYYALDAL